jgi:hypothetical protein
MTNNFQSRFNAAFTNISNVNKMLADYYISDYWNNDTQDFEWDMIDESVVREIEKDSQMVSQTD